MILVYEYMSNGSLRGHLYGSQNGYALTWKQRLQICIDAAQGLDFQQTIGVKHVLHHNLKPGNILLDDKWVAKVSSYMDLECTFANGIKHTTKSLLFGLFAYI